MSQSKITHFKEYLLKLQQAICSSLAEIDGGQFVRDSWQRPQGGEGNTHALSDGKIIEKAGVNFSHVWGESLPPAATATRPELAGSSFHALGVSVIIHPRNPYAPTSHFNIRLFMAEKKDGEVVWWFGGGFDLTPYYGFVEDCQHWHQTAQAACDPFGSQLYPQFKKAADEYFYLKHRQEARGIGGIFFDDVNWGDFDQTLAFACSVGDHFLPAYLPILNKRCHTSYGERQQNFQHYRRGRYVEFNLIYDRGTLFGLQFGGRIESILLSLPPVVHWRYDWAPPTESEEAALLRDFLQPREWI